MKSTGNILGGNLFGTLAEVRTNRGGTEIEAKQDAKRNLRPA